MFDLNNDGLINGLDFGLFDEIFNDNSDNMQKKDILFDGDDDSEGDDDIW